MSEDSLTVSAEEGMALARIRSRKTWAAFCRRHADLGLVVNQTGGKRKNLRANVLIAIEREATGLVAPAPAAPPAIIAAPVQRLDLTSLLPGRRGKTEFALFVDKLIEQYAERKQRLGRQ